MSKPYITETVHNERVKGGHLETCLDGKHTKIDIRMLRQEIPAHCFQPSTFRSISFVIHDLCIYFIILSIFIWLDKRVNYWFGVLIRLIVYPFLASLPLTGLWVLAHECGHGAFSANSVVANIFGFILHSALLAPYFAWRSSHARHHQFANNISTDLNYVPPTKEEYKELFRGKVDLDHMVEDAPIIILFRIVTQQIVGWPWYLLTHITAGPHSSPKPSRGWWDNSHFMASSSLFRPNEFWAIVGSDVGIIATCLALYVGGERFGTSTVLWVYVLPWMWVNHWIVMITYLHHTSPSLPKYTPESWTYIRGALATVDRDPGAVLKYMFHHIIDLHVIHHLFPRIPHYHAREATGAIKHLLGPYYHVDKGSYWRALWIGFTQCQWVEADPDKTLSATLYSTPQASDENVKGSKASNETGVLWYRSGRMPRPATVMHS
ncbi:fatty acid desaturase-domain-containing protein [Whalleya microplaca]|nr:fatty acid desaturase-domain-containing protein [Whalleya microplaca]